MDMVDTIVNGALRHVAVHGWTDAAVAAAVADLGLPSVSAGVVRGGAGLVEAFIKDCNRRLATVELALPELPSENDIKHAVIVARVEMILPHIGSWPQALAILAQPNVLPSATRLIGETAEAITNTVEARTGVPTDGLERMARQTGVAAVYGAAELYATQVAGPDPEVSRIEIGQFVDRRLLQLNAVRAVIPPELPTILEGFVAVGKNILGFPQRRS
jgi:ubiquinone biosynthesis protein COQ9